MPQILGTDDAGRRFQSCDLLVGFGRWVADGDSFLYKNPDSAIKRGKFDAERSTPGNLVIIPV